MEHMCLEHSSIPRIYMRISVSHNKLIFQIYVQVLMALFKDDLCAKKTTT